MKKQIVKKNVKKNPRKDKKLSGATVDGSIVDLEKFRTDKVIFFKDIVPPRIFTKLKYILNRKLNNAGMQVASIQLNANGIFDIDPAVGSNRVAGFQELATIWERYRVYGVHAKVDFVNLDASAPIVNLGFDSEFYTANTKGIDHYDGPNQLAEVVGGLSFGKLRLQMKRNGQDVIGDSEVYYAGGYAGTSTTNPASLWYCSIAADLGPAGGTFTSGITVRCELTIDVEFFERFLIDSSLLETNKRNLQMQKDIESYFLKKNILKGM